MSFGPFGLIIGTFRLPSKMTFHPQPRVDRHEDHDQIEAADEAVQEANVPLDCGNVDHVDGRREEVGERLDGGFTIEADSDLA